MSKFFLLKSGKKSEIIPARVFENPNTLRILTNPLGWRIYQNLLLPQCPIDLARKLGMHEQKVYYYVRKLKKLGLIEEVGREARHGTLAKFYRAKNHALAIRLKGARKERIDVHFPKVNLEPFIVDRKPDFTIVVGSPDPHGPWKARALDSPAAIDLALFLGSLSSEVGQNYKLDIEVRERDLRRNLILVGGPIANMITKKVNNKLPVSIDTKTKDIRSGISGKTYRDDEHGLICMVQNPWNPSKKILAFAGKRFPGTRASILAFITDPERIMEGNRFDKTKIARVVRGYDLNGDGIVDSAEILE